MDLTSFPIRHGGDLSVARRVFGKPADGWLDLSTGVNPWPWPFGELDPESLTRLPQEDALAALRESARGAYGIPSDNSVIAAPGSQALIQLLPGLRRRSRVAVLAPTYEEHAAAWRRLGHTVDEVAALADGRDADVVVVVNPNNPDGRVIERSTLVGIAQRLAARDGWLLVDETFADVAPRASLASMPGLANALVIRSFGKFFGLPGLRLGFIAGAPALADTIARRLGPWAVSGPALDIGRRALVDAEWASDTRRRLAAMRRKLDAVLAEGGLTVVGGTDLFSLVEAPAARHLHRALGRAGILVRAFERHPRWLRVGIPPSAEALHRLAVGLKNALPDGAVRQRA